MANDANQIVAISRRWFNPRRPVDKPTAADKEEMLIPYSPVVPIDTKKIISHAYDVSTNRSFI